MRKLSVFNFVTLNGFYKGEHGDIGWHKHGDAEENEYAMEGLKSESTLLFGRKTYEMMAGYWPTEMAKKNDPVVAEGMNKADKIVFSRTLKKAGWNNTRIINDNLAKEVEKLKQEPGNDMTILGSGSILTQLAAHGLIDEYQIMIDPVAIGKGVPIFNELPQELHLKLTMTRTFKSGVVLLCYESLKK